MKREQSAVQVFLESTSPMDWKMFYSTESFLSNVWDDSCFVQVLLSILGFISIFFNLFQYLMITWHLSSAQALVYLKIIPAAGVAAWSWCASWEISPWDLFPQPGSVCGAVCGGSQRKPGWILIKQPKKMGKVWVSLLFAKGGSWFSAERLHRGSGQCPVDISPLPD